MDKKKKILHICSYYINDAFYNMLFSHLEQRGVKNYPYTFANVNQKKKNKKLQGQVSYCFNTFDRLFFYRKHKKVWNDFLQHPELLSCDLIHAHSLFSNGYIAQKLYRQKGIPYVVTVRYPDVLTFFQYMPHLRKLGGSILMEAQAVIFLSPTYLEKTMKYLSLEEQELLSKKACIIPNGIDDFWIENRIRDVHKKSIPNNHLQLLFVGKVNKNKNLDILLHTASLLQKKGYAVTVTVAGKIQDKSYEKKIKKYDFVHYAGQCDKQQLQKLYRSADIFILLSRKESFGLVYAEALSQGLPVIYTKGQGFDGQFPDGQVGYAVSDSDADQVIEAIEKIMADYESYSRRAVKASTKFAWNTIVEDWIQIYNDKDGKHECL